MQNTPSYCVVVADSARARFFELSHPDEPLFEGGPDLVEVEDLVNPEAEAQPRELFANRRGADKPAFRGGQSQRYDDHREDHVDEIDRRFARDLAEHIVTFLKGRQPDHAVLVATPRLIGILRPELPENGLSLAVVESNLTAQSPTEIQAHLAKNDLLPERKPPQGQRGRRDVPS